MEYSLYYNFMHILVGSLDDLVVFGSLEVYTDLVFVYCQNIGEFFCPLNGDFQLNCRVNSTILKIIVK